MSNGENLMKEQETELKIVLKRKENSKNLRERDEIRNIENYFT